jgi:hypothetical protein
LKKQRRKWIRKWLMKQVFRHVWRKWHNVEVIVQTNSTTEFIPFPYISHTHTHTHRQTDRRKFLFFFQQNKNGRDICSFVYLNRGGKFLDNKKERKKKMVNNLSEKVNKRDYTITT